MKLQTRVGLLAFALSMTSGASSVDSPVAISPTGLVACLYDSSCIRLEVKNTGAYPVSFGVEPGAHPIVPEPLFVYQRHLESNWEDYAFSIGTFVEPKEEIEILSGCTEVLFVWFPNPNEWTEGAPFRLGISDSNGITHYTPVLSAEGFGAETEPGRSN